MLFWSIEEEWTDGPWWFQSLLDFNGLWFGMNFKKQWQLLTVCEINQSNTKAYLGWQNTNNTIYTRDTSSLIVFFSLHLQMVKKEVKCNTRQYKILLILLILTNYLWALHFISFIYLFYNFLHSYQFVLCSRKIWVSWTVRYFFLSSQFNEAACGFLGYFFTSLFNTLITMGTLLILEGGWEMKC